MNQGMHHVGLATHDMERTIEFYEEVLGFPAVVCEMIEMPNGGAVRHAFFDAGGGELVAAGSPADIARNPNSHTGAALAAAINA